MRPGLAVMCCRTRRAAHQQGEAAFAERPHRAEQLVVAAVVHAEAAPIGGLLERDVDPDAGAVVAGAGRVGRP